MALFGSLATVRAQLADPRRFTAALGCVEACLAESGPLPAKLAALAPGQSARLDLADGAFAILQAYETRPRGEGKWESHRAYIDVQAVTSGEEQMELADISRLRLAEDLTPGTDALFYHPYGDGSLLRMKPGTVAVYFPADGHAGGVQMGSPGLVRKVVVKVPIV